MPEKKNNKNKWIELAVILKKITLGIFHACFDVKIPFLPKSRTEKAAEEWQKNLEKKTEDLKKVNMRMIDKTEP